MEFRRIFFFASVAILLCFPYAISAQNHKNTDSLKRAINSSPNDTNKLSGLYSLCSVLQETDQVDSALYYAYQYEALAKRIRFNRYTGSLFNSIGNRYFQEGNFTVSLECYLKALSLSKDNDNKKTLGAILGNLGNIYMKQGNYPQAIDYYYKAIQITKEVGNKEGLASHLSNLAIAYEEQGNYAEALDNNYKALKLAYETGKKYVISHTLNNIGVIYDRKGEYDSALHYQLKALAVAMEINQPENLADIGNTYSDQGNYPKALEYYSKALSVARQSKDKDGIANLYSSIGRVYIKLRNYKDAQMFLDSALVLSKNVGDKIYIRDTYRGLSALDSATGNYKTSFSDYEKYIAYRDSLINQESIRRITQMEISHRYERREDSIIAEQEKANIIRDENIKRNGIITYSAIVISILTLVVALLLISRQQTKRKQDRINFENEKQRIENELKNARAMLDDYVKSMIEKNDLIEQFKNDLEQVKNLKKQEEVEEKRIEHLDYLNKTTILTEDDWIRFKELFEQVHKGFFVRLKEKLPNLTQAETRLVCLTKLKLDTKHMASIIGVSAATIEQTRYRFKKKLNLSKDDNLNEFIESV